MYSLELEENPHYEGFCIWVICEYWAMIDHLLHKNEEFLEPNEHGYQIEFTYSSDGKEIFAYKGLNIFRAMDKWDVFGQSDPKIALHNLQTYINLFNIIIDNRGIRSQEGCPALSDAPQKDGPLSVQLYRSLEYLKDMVCFSADCAALQQTRILRIYDRFMKFYPKFEGYIKGVAVAELNAILNSDLSDEAAVEAVEMQLNNKVTLGILRENRQSSWEQNLKLLSVISMLIGVGIFTTLGLACKRYYDSGGTSINFFKPLSENLCETMIQITENTHPHMP